MRLQIPGTRHARRLVVEVIAWVLVFAGLAALVLPGPGLLLLFAGLLLLSQQYTWAQRHVEPVRARALEAARQGVATGPRIVLSLIGVAWLAGLGVVWGLHPDPPAWWMWPERWWLPGGWGTGISLIVSAAIALGTIIYSIRRFRRTEESQAEESLDHN